MSAPTTASSKAGSPTPSASSGYGVFVKTAVESLDQLDSAAGKPAKTAMVVHEDSAFGTGTANLLAELPGIGIEVIEVIKHPTPNLDFDDVVLRIKAQEPERRRPGRPLRWVCAAGAHAAAAEGAAQGDLSVWAGPPPSTASSRNFPEATTYIIDTNHRYNPKKAAALELKKKVEARASTTPTRSSSTTRP